MFRLMPITRSPAQKSARKDLSRNGQSPAITPEATYVPVSNRAGSRSALMKIGHRCILIVLGDEVTMKRDKKADEAAVIDMNDTLMDYAHKRQPHVDDLAEELANRAKDNLEAIDTYLNDGGEARKEYQAIAEGYLRDKYNLDGDELLAARDELVHAAIHYLLGHTKVLDDWQR